MAAARIVMYDWSQKYLRLLLDTNLRVDLLSGYVDDGRQITSKMKLGTRFNQDEKKFEITDEWRLEDEKTGESHHKRMSRECLKAMNSINPDLKFTVEIPEDFIDGRIPTLDTDLWIDENGVIHHSYFQKSMKSPYILMKRSAISDQQRYSILSNELIRRLSNLSQEISQAERLQVVETFTTEMKNSGYERKQANEAVISGLKGFTRKVENRRKAGMNFYRTAKETLKPRIKKKLLQKTTWYKTKPRDEKENNIAGKIGGDEIRSKRSNLGLKKGRIEKQGNTKSKIKAVIFVPFTEGSKLARKMKEAEDNLEKVTGYRFKIVERAGNKI